MIELRKHLQYYGDNYSSSTGFSFVRFIFIVIGLCVVIALGLYLYRRWQARQMGAAGAPGYGAPIYGAPQQPGMAPAYGQNPTYPTYPTYQNNATPVNTTNRDTINYPGLGGGEYRDTYK